MEFRHPAYFILLLLLPALIYFSKRRQHVSLAYSNNSFLKKGEVSLRTLFFRFLPLLRVLSFALFVFALARPQQVTAEKEYETNGVDIVISLDISGSMLAEDFKPENRMVVAKQEAVKFVKGRENDRIGMVVFAKKAYTQCPLTTDYNILTQLIDEIQIGMIADGTAIGMGLATSVNRLRDSKSKSKVIILITDGSNNAGNIDPVTAAELAKAFNIKVYSICIGRGGMVPFPVNDPLFGKRYIQANVEIDELVLKRISDITGGLYFRARDPRSLSEIYEKINKLEKTEIKVKEYRSFNELFSLFLVPALLLLLIEIVLSRTVLLKVP